MKTAPQLRNLPGFTLIEFMVVVAIIGVLAAILLPALARAKDKARSVQCLNNLKQWSLAMAMYVDDNEFIPREGYRGAGRVRRDNWAQVNDDVIRDAWYNALAPYLKQSPARAYFSAQSGARSQFYLNRIFHCPSAKFPAEVGSYPDAYFSLAMNSKLIQPPVLAVGTIPFSMIERPSDTAIFLDARVSEEEKKVDSLQWDADLGQPSIFASRFSARHSDGGNLAFGDGHVTWMAGRSVVETRRGWKRGLAIFPDGDIIWCPDPLAEPNGPD